MAADAAPQGDTPTPLHWRRGLLALLPLAFLGFMPLAMCLGLGAVILLGLRFPAWESGRLLLLLLVVALGALLQLPGAWGQGFGALVGLGSAYLLYLGAALLLNLALIPLEENRRRGLLLVLLPGLLAPQWGLVPALLGGLLGREGPDDRLARWQAPLSRRVWGGVAAAAAALTLLGALLPQTQMRFQEVPTRQTAPVPVREGPSEPDAQPDEAQTRAPSSRSAGPPFVVEVDEKRLSVPPFEVLVLLSALPLLVLIVLERRFRTRTRARPPTLLERLMVLGLVLSCVLTLAAALLMQRGGSAADLQSSLERLTGAGREARELSPEGAVRSIEGTGFVNSFSWGLALLLALTAALLFFRWRGPTDRLAASGAEARGAAEGTAVPAPALHRIRLAYRQAEDALHAAGQPRTPAETPAGYAARLGTDFPDLQAPLQTLTRAYEPVRYGGRVTDEDADSAAAAAARITELAPALSVPEPKGTP